MVVWPPRRCVSNTGGILLTVVHECLCMANILVEINLAAWKRSAKPPNLISHQISGYTVCFDPIRARNVYRDIAIDTINLPSWS